MKDVVGIKTLSRTKTSMIQNKEVPSLKTFPTSSGCCDMERKFTKGLELYRMNVSIELRMI